MDTLYQQIQKTAKNNPNKIALQTQQQAITYSELIKLIEQTIISLQGLSPKLVAIHAENCPAWVVVDLACQILNICVLPLPTFFSEEQSVHAVESSAADLLLIAANKNNQASYKQLIQVFTNKRDNLSIAEQQLAVYTRTRDKAEHFPKETGKITFTSGSTGRAKGVCLSNSHILDVVLSLKKTLALPEVKHLSLLPLSTLLENIAGIYIPLLSSGTAILLPPKETGLFGSSMLDMQTLLSCLSQYQPETLILIPELLRILLTGIQQGWQAPKSLKFIAVGGAKVSPDLVRQARQVGLPVYEGYGLSECASVVCLNTPDADCQGSVGKPLGHTELIIEEDELIVKDPIFLGYLNQPESWYPSFFKTGDIASQDAQGFVHIEGRKKNILISSFGRNISPEWLESELSNYFKQSIVFGDSQPYCIALLAPYQASASDDTIQANIDLINQKLPDYAQIQSWIKLKEPLTTQSGLLTETGKLKRGAIYQNYQEQIEQLYQGE